MLKFLVWLKGWVKAHPWVGAFGAALAGLGIFSVRLRWAGRRIAKYRDKAAQLEAEITRTAVTARVKAIRAERERLHNAGLQHNVVEHGAEMAGKAAEKKVLEAASKCRKVIPVILLAASASLALAVEPPVPCLDRMKLSGILVELEFSESTELTKDAALIIRNLCVALDSRDTRITALGEQMGLLEDQLALADETISMVTTQMDLFRERFVECSSEVAKITPMQRWGGCVGPGFSVNADGEAFLTGTIVWGLRF